LSKKRLLGENFFIEDMDTTIQVLENKISQHKFEHLMFSTGYRFSRSLFSKKIKSIYKKATMIIPEGKSMRWALGIKNKIATNRITQIDTFINLVRGSLKNEQTLFLLGSKKDTLSTAIGKLQQSFKGIKIVGSHPGYFSKKREKDILEAIKKLSPAILFVGTGFPHQEIWIQKNKKYFPNSVCIGIGNSFELSAGSEKRAPVKLRKWGLEGFYRFLKKPIRFIRIFPLLIFIFLVMKEKTFRRFKKK